MKHLYLIFRLFKCPHRWVLIKSSTYNRWDGYPARYIIENVKVFEMKCLRCGKYDVIKRSLD